MGLLIDSDDSEITLPKAAGFANKSKKKTLMSNTDHQTAFISPVHMLQ